MILRRHTGSLAQVKCQQTPFTKSINTDSLVVSIILEFRHSRYHLMDIDERDSSRREASGAKCLNL